MKTAFQKSFARDLKKMRDRSILECVREVIAEVEGADDLAGISGLKKLSGAEDCYRIRIGDYRIGPVLEEGTVVFVRCLPRRDMNRYFP